MILPRSIARVLGHSLGEGHAARPLLPVLVGALAHGLATPKTRRLALAGLRLPEEQRVPPGFPKTKAKNLWISVEQSRKTNKKLQSFHIDRKKHLGFPLIPLFLPAVTTSLAQRRPLATYVHHLCLGLARQQQKGLFRQKGTPGFCWKRPFRPTAIHMISLRGQKCTELNFIPSSIGGLRKFFPFNGWRGWEPM